jgi:hypothetical protein
MHEQTKINEAKYFLAKMTALVNDRDAFNFNLSAFLAAARSVLQYANKEAQRKSEGQKWYDGQVAGKPVVRFFKDKRDVSIHVNSVSPSAKIGVSVAETICVTDSISVTIYRKDGTIEEERSLSSSPPSSPPEEIETSVTCEYFFHDWSGSEDVLQLCQMYITEGEAIISDGVANGFLTL